jgi:methyl-accepting chemotaxis protein
MASNKPVKQSAVAPAVKKTTKNPSKGTGLRNIIFTSMFAASVIPVGVSSYLSYDKAKTDLAAQSDTQLRFESQSNADLLTSWIDGNMTAVKFMAQASDLTSMDVDKAALYVKSLQKSAPYFYAFFLINPDGMQIAKSDDKLNNVSDRAYFKKSIKGEPFYQISISKTTNKPAFLPAAPVKNADNAIVGSLGAGADMDLISDKITGRKIGKSGFSYLVGEDNSILAHPDKSLIGKDADNALKNLNSDTVSQDAVVDGKNIKRNVTTVGNGLKLVSQIDLAEVEAPLVDTRNSAITFLGLAAFLSLIFSFILGSAIAKSINQLSLLSDKLSVAQSGAEIDKVLGEINNVKGSREVKALGGALGRLAQSIKLALEALS